MTEELLEKIPAERCWAITAKTLTTFAVVRGAKTILPLLGKGEGIISPIWGWEKWMEINEKAWGGESGRKVYPLVNRIIDMPVEDAIGAAKLLIAAIKLQQGPEWEPEIVEATRERAVVRYAKCPWIERYKELGVNPERMVCPPAHQAWNNEGLKAINQKITYTLTKSRPEGDPYCEAVIEFKEE